MKRCARYLEEAPLPMHALHCSHSQCFRCLHSLSPTVFFLVPLLSRNPLLPSSTPQIADFASTAPTYANFATQFLLQIEGGAQVSDHRLPQSFMQRHGFFSFCACQDYACYCRVCGYSFTMRVRLGRESRTENGLV